MTDAHVLLARALATLTDAEQGQVLKSLLPVPTFGAADPAWSSQATAAMAGMAMGREHDVVAAFLGRHVPESPGSSETVSLLVRLPAPLHAQLKAWSEQHGHSMNTVVRGLLERFLAARPGS